MDSITLAINLTIRRIELSAGRRTNDEFIGPSPN